MREIFKITTPKFDSKDILELREYEYRHSTLMSSSKYIKLRGRENE